MKPLPQLQLYFEPLAEGRYQVRITLPTGHQDQGIMQLPFATSLIGLLLRAIEWQLSGHLLELNESLPLAAMAQALGPLGLWESSQHNSQAAPDAPERLGRILGEALQRDPALRRGFSALHDMAAGAGGGELVLVFPPELADLTSLPWESSRVNDAPLLIRNGVILACTRIIKFAHLSPKPRLPGRQLRILTVTPHAFMTEVHTQFAQTARATMAQALAGREVTIESLADVTLPGLASRLSMGGVDIIDYCGHGVVTERGGALVFDDEAGRRFVLAEELAGLPNLPPFVVLSACLGAFTAQPESLDSIAGRLSAAGVRAVVAMQFSIKMKEYCEVVVPALYKTIAEGGSVQQACAAARRALFLADKSGESWYVPALYLRQPDLNPYVVIPVAPPAPNPFLSHRARASASNFIGREDQLETIWSVIGNRTNSVALVGPTGSGKTAIMKKIATEAQVQIEVEAIALTIRSDSTRATLELDLARQLAPERKVSAKDCQSLLRGRHILLLLDNLGELDSESTDGYKVRNWLRSLGQVSDDTSSVQIVSTSLIPLSEIFKGDERRYPNVSPFFGIISTVVHLPPFSEVDARAYVAAHLVGTSFQIEDFIDIVQKPLQPEALRRACELRYTELAK